MQQASRENVRSPRHVEGALRHNDQQEKLYEKESYRQFKWKIDCDVVGGKHF
jgi:hypothetical protein